MTRENRTETQESIDQKGMMTRKSRASADEGFKTGDGKGNWIFGFLIDARQFRLQQTTNPIGVSL